VLAPRFAPYLEPALLLFPSSIFRTVLFFPRFFDVQGFRASSRVSSGSLGPAAFLPSFRYLFDVRNCAVRWSPNPFPRFSSQSPGGSPFLLPRAHFCDRRAPVLLRDASFFPGILPLLLIPTWLLTFRISFFPSRRDLCGSLLANVLWSCPFSCFLKGRLLAPE